MHTREPQHTCGSQVTTFRNWLSPSAFLRQSLSCLLQLAQEQPFLGCASSLDILTAVISPTSFGTIVDHRA